MKKFYLSHYCMALLIGSIALLGCKKFLTEKPIDQLNQKQAYSNPTLVYLNVVANLYTKIGGSGGGQGLGGTDRGLYDLQTFTNDEAILPTRGGDWEDGGLWQDLFNQKWTVNNGILKDTWNYLYSVVGLCNQSLDKLQELKTADPQNTKLDTYIAEVRSTRAVYYYYLLDLFARVPVVTSFTTPIAEVKQSERKEVFEFVVKEFQEVYPFLAPDKSNLLGAYYGRITRPVAFMYLAKLALNAQVYSDNNWTDNSGNPNGSTDFPGYANCWDATIAYCDSIGNYGYKLESDYTKNFAIGNETSAENIFTIPMDPIQYPGNRFMYNVRTMHYDHAKAYNVQGWNGSSLTKTGLQIFGFGGATEDPRLKLSFFTGAVNGHDGQPVRLAGTTTPLVYQPNAVAIDVSNTPYEKTAGARWHKYEIDKNALEGGQLVSNDFVIFRYADVLLMKAEAMVRCTKGDGLKEVNDVRTRAGITTPLTSLSLQDILDERFRELSWEGVRRQDLVRYGKFHVANLDRITVSSPARCVFLIPADVLAVNSNLTQNPTD